MALELGPRRIAASVVAPCPIATDSNGGDVLDNPYGAPPRRLARRSRPGDRRAAFQRSRLGQRPADGCRGRRTDL